MWGTIMNVKQSLKIQWSIQNLYVCKDIIKDSIIFE